MISKFVCESLEQRTLMTTTITPIAGVFIPVTTGTISGTVFTDANGNGVRDAGENVMAGVTVYCDQIRNGQLDLTEVSFKTDANGNYFFSNLPSSWYYIKAVPPASQRVSTPAPPPIPVGTVSPDPLGPVFEVPLQPGQIVTGKNFGLTNRVAISGRAYRSDVVIAAVVGAKPPGIAGVKIELVVNGVVVGTRTTDSDGNWSFKSLSPGTASVRVVSPAGYRVTHPASGSYSGTLAAGQSRSDLSFGFDLLGDSSDYAPFIMGKAFIDNNGNAVRDAGDQPMNLTFFLDINNNSLLDSGEPTAITDAMGEFIFINATPGHTIVRTILPLQFQLVTPAQPKFELIVQPNQTYTTPDFGFKNSPFVFHVNPLPHINLPDLGPGQMYL